MPDKKKFLDLAGLQIYNTRIKEWTYDKIHESIPQLSKVASTGSYNDLKDKTHEIKVVTNVLDDSSVKFAYRSYDFNNYMEIFSPDASYDGQPEFALSYGYYYNVTFDEVLYENLVPEKITIRGESYNSSYNCLGLGNPALFTQARVDSISDGVKDLPFYILSDGSAGALYATTKGEHTVTVQWTGEKIPEDPLFMSMGVWTQGATTSEELMEMVQGGTYQMGTVPEFEEGVDYPVTLGNEAYSFQVKKVIIPEFGSMELPYFGSESLINSALKFYGIEPVDFDTYTEGDLAILFAPMEGDDAPCYCTTVTSKSLEISSEISEAVGGNPMTAPMSLQVCNPNISADMTLLQYGQQVEILKNVDPLGNVLYGQLTTGDAEPSTDPQNLTFTTRDVDRQDCASATVDSESVYGSPNGYQSGDSYMSWYEFDGIEYNNQTYIWQDTNNTNIYYVGNPDFYDEIYNFYDFTQYSEDQMAEIHNCKFLLKIEIPENFDSSNPMYKQTLYTKYHGLHTLRGLKFDTKYPIQYYDQEGNPLVHDQYGACTDSRLENYNYVRTDWYRCLDDGLKLKKGQEVFVKLGDIEYSLVIKEDETGFTYAGNPEFMPSEFYSEGLEVVPNIPFFICSHHRAYGNKFPEPQSNKRNCTRIYFDPDAIREIKDFVVKYDSINVIKAFDYETLEPSLPQIDWNNSDETSKQHILNRTHYDGRKGLFYDGQGIRFYKSFYDKSTSSYPVVWPFTEGEDYTANVSLAYNGQTFFERSFTSTLISKGHSSTEFDLQDNDIHLLFTKHDSKEAVYGLNVVIYTSVIPLNMLNDKSNITLSLSINNDLLTVSDITATSGTNGVYPSRSAYSVTKDGVSTNFYGLQFQFRDWRLENLPFVSGGTYTVFINDKKFEVPLSSRGYNSTTYSYLGNWAYYQKVLNYRITSVTSLSEEKDFKFFIKVDSVRDSKDYIRITSAEVYIDGELLSEIEYPNFKGLSISYGTVKELDKKYLPDISYEDIKDAPVIPEVPAVAQSIAQNETGYTTGDQVYQYVTSAISVLTGVMHFKNSISSASDIPANPALGDVYISNGTFTYNSEQIEPGDLFIRAENGWTVVQGNLTLDSISNSEINNLFNGGAGE